MKRWTIFIVLLSILTQTFAQDVGDIRKRITDLLETMAAQQEQTFEFEEMVNDLIRISQHPINLNNTTKEELEQLIFLSDQQIENLLFYQYANKQFYTVYELQGVEGMDSTSIQHLLPFVIIGEPSMANTRHSEGQLLVRVQRQLQQASGYQSPSDSTPPPYQGSPEKVLLRGRYNYKGKMEAGVTLEKDQGEAYFPTHATLTDFSSGFFMLNQPVKHINKVIVGDYRASFGQGLGLWTDMAFSKTVETSQLRRRSRGFNPYTSVNESSFLRGLSCEATFGPFTISPFISFKARDANLITDTLDTNEAISSLQETGYHRTLNEIADHNAINELVTGCNVAFKHHLVKLDAGMLHWAINADLHKGDALKDIHAFKGHQLQRAWLAHSVFLGQLIVFGEVTLQNDLETGVFQGLSYNVGNDIHLSAAYRRYSKDSFNQLSQPFAESSNAAGESGIYAAISFKPFKKVTVNAYADAFSYQWMRYDAYAPSDGFEWFAQLRYDHNNRNHFYLRIKEKTKQTNTGADTRTYELVAAKKQSMRLFYDYRHNDRWDFQTQLELSRYEEYPQSAQHGFLAYQELGYTTTKGLAATARLVVFDIDDYNARIYSYEPDVLYAFTIPAYQDAGTRFIGTLHFTLFKDCVCWVRAAHTIYSNKTTIGSSHQTIRGSQLTEAKLQLRYRF